MERGTTAGECISAPVAPCPALSSAPQYPAGLFAAATRAEPAGRLKGGIASVSFRGHLRPAADHPHDRRVRCMAMGKRKNEQTPMWVPTTELPVSPGHPFYAKLNAILDEAGFDRFAEAECQQFYAPVMGRPGLPPGRFSLAAGRLLRRARLRARDRVARGGLAGRAQLRGPGPRHGRPGSFDDLADPAVGRTLL